MNIRALFLDGDLSATLDAQLERARRAVDEIPEREFSESERSSIVNRLHSRFVVQPIELTEGAISVQAEDADIDRRRFSDFDYSFSGASPTLRGTRVIYNVPFTGDATLFRLKPSTWTTSVLYASVAGSELRFIYEVPTPQVAGTKARFDRDLTEAKQWLGWSNKEVEQFNAKLVSTIENTVNARSNRLTAASEGLAALGLPVRPSASPAAATSSSGGVAPSPVAVSPGGEYDVALSFAGEDRAYVQEVATQLAAAGARVFFDEFESVRLWGKDLVAHLQDIYQNKARFCVMFISEHYVNKPWPSHERRSAQARALLAKEEYLLPARFDDAVVPGMPPTIGYLDLRTLGPKEFAKIVLAKIGSRAA